MKAETSGRWNSSYFVDLQTRLGALISMNKNQQHTMPASKSPMLTMSAPGPRTLSPVSRPRAISPYKSRSLKKKQHDPMYESDIGLAPEFETDEDEESVASGIRYITESLIKKLTKQESLAFVTALNLCLSKDGGKKFKYIENLEKCERLEILNLSYNLIEKIEKLEKQSKLHKLNLSYNKISKIEGLEHMQSLQTLNLAGNNIEHIPPWFGKKLRSLCTLNLKQNKISSFQEIAKLKPLKDLTSLYLADNPVANLPHYRLCTIFHLRSLENLEGQSITSQERQEAHERFNLGMNTPKNQLKRAWVQMALTVAKHVVAKRWMRKQPPSHEEWIVELTQCCSYELWLCKVGKLSMKKADVEESQGSLAEINCQIMSHIN